MYKQPTEVLKELLEQFTKHISGSNTDFIVELLKLIDNNASFLDELFQLISKHYGQKSSIE